MAGTGGSMGAGQGQEDKFFAGGGVVRISGGAGCPGRGISRGASIRVRGVVMQVGPICNGVGVAMEGRGKVGGSEWAKVGRGRGQTGEGRGRGKGEAGDGGERHVPGRSGRLGMGPVSGIIDRALSAR